jgi:hypothetical protein
MIEAFTNRNAEQHQHCALMSQPNNVDMDFVTYRHVGWIKKRTLRCVKVMSALPPKADMCVALAYVCFGPIADIRHLNSIT